MLPAEITSDTVNVADLDQHHFHQATTHIEATNINIRSLVIECGMSPYGYKQTYSRPKLRAVPPPARDILSKTPDRRRAEAATPWR